MTETWRRLRAEKDEKTNTTFATVDSLTALDSLWWILEQRFLRQRFLEQRFLE